MQHALNQPYKLYLLILNERTIIAYKYLFAIGVSVVILFIMLLVVYNNKNKKAKALENSRKALNKSKKQAESLQVQKQIVEQCLKTLNTKLTDIKKKYNNSLSDLNAEKTKLANLQQNYATCLNDLEGKNIIINRLSKEVEKLKQDLIEVENTHRNELDHITDQMKTAYKSLESGSYLVQVAFKCPCLNI